MIVFSFFGALLLPLPNANCCAQLEKPEFENDIDVFVFVNVRGTPPAGGGGGAGKVGTPSKA